MNDVQKIQALTNLLEKNRRETFVKTSDLRAILEDDGLEGMSLSRLEDALEDAHLANSNGSHTEEIEALRHEIAQRVN